MTYFKTALMSAAALAIAAPAFANHHGEQTDHMMNKTKVEAETTVTMDAQTPVMPATMTPEEMKAHKMKTAKMKSQTMQSETVQDGVIKTDKMMLESRTDVMGATQTMDPSKANDTVGEILQSDGEPSIQADQEIIVDTTQMTEGEFRAEDDDGMIRDNAIVVPGSGNTLTTVTCPAGTEAQVDMTCLITGNFEFDG